MKTLLLLLLASAAHAGGPIRTQDFPDFKFPFPSSGTFAGSLDVQGPITATGTITANQFVGNGSGLTGVATAVDLTTFTAALNTKLSSGAAIGGDLSGTNLAPLVIHTQAGAVDFSTITAALSTKLSSGAVPSGFVDFSTITAALNTKLSSGAVPSGFVDFSTITAALNTKLSSGAIPSGFVDFSTITAALITNSSTFTILGNSFSVGGSTFIVSGGRVGIGATSPLYKLYVTSGNVGIDYGVASTTYVFRGTTADPATTIPGMVNFRSDLNQLRLYENTDGWVTLSTGSSSGSGLAVVAHGPTLTGSGTSGDPLHVASALTISNLTSTNTAGFGLTTSSGVSVASGVYAGFFVGSGSGLINLPPSASVSVSTAMFPTRQNGFTNVGFINCTDTGTITTSGGTALLIGGNIQTTNNSVGFDATTVFVLIDGNFLPGERADRGITAAYTYVSTVQGSSGFLTRTPTLSAGVHNFCVGYGVSGATGNACTDNSYFVCSITATEVRPN